MFHSLKINKSLINSKIKNIKPIFNLDMAQRPGERTGSLIGKSLQEVKKLTRPHYEKEDVTRQCSAVLGAIPVKTIETMSADQFRSNFRVDGSGGAPRCWLCNFKVFGLLNNNFLQGPGTRVKNIKVVKPMLDKATCEHVLPIKVAIGFSQLYQRTVLAKVAGNIDDYFRRMHTEYEYAHNYCNFVKNDTYFVSLLEGSTNFCDLRLKEDKIWECLDEIVNGRRTGEHNSTVIVTYNDGTEKRFINNVEAYLELNGMDKDEWKRLNFAAIKLKMNGLISHIKESDGCYEGDASLKGRWSKGWKERMKYGWKYFEQVQPPLDSIDEEDVRAGQQQSARRSGKPKPKQSGVLTALAGLAPAPAARVGSYERNRECANTLLTLNPSTTANRMRDIPHSATPVALGENVNGEPFWNIQGCNPIKDFDRSHQPQRIPKARRNTIRREAAAVSEGVRQRKRAAAETQKRKQEAAAAAAKKAADNAARAAAQIRARQLEDRDAEDAARVRWSDNNPVGKDKRTKLFYYGQFSNGDYIYAFSDIEQGITDADDARRRLQQLQNQEALEEAWGLWQENQIAGLVRGLPYYGRYSDGSYIFGFRANQSEILDEGEARQEMERLQREAAEEARRQREAAEEARRQREQAAEERRQAKAADAARRQRAQVRQQPVRQQQVRQQQVRQQRRGQPARRSEQQEEDEDEEAIPYTEPEGFASEEEENNNESNSGSNSENNNAAEQRGQRARKAAEAIPEAAPPPRLGPRATAAQLAKANVITRRIQEAATHYQPGTSWAAAPAGRAEEERWRAEEIARLQSLINEIRNGRENWEININRQNRQRIQDLQGDIRALQRGGRKTTHKNQKMNKNRTKKYKKLHKGTVKKKLKSRRTLKMRR
jgi:hypothetical protein